MTSELIIETPHLQNLQQRYGFATLTLLFWALWLYLWLPLMSLLAWFLGINIFYTHMLELGGYAGFLELLGWYAITVLLIGIIFGVWMMVNIFRFRGKEKRHPVADVEDYEVADYFGVDSEFLSDFADKRSLVVHLSAEGEITSIAKSGT